VPTYLSEALVAEIAFFMNRIYVWSLLLCCVLSINLSWSQEEDNIAHIWNEEVLEGIRNDFARPTVHARNLLHTSIAMYDCWAAYDNGPSETFFLGKAWSGFEVPFEGVVIPDSPAALAEARDEAISYAAYRIMIHRFGETPDGEITLFNINSRMAQLGYDPSFVSTDYVNDGAPALGNYVAEQIIAFGLQDGSNEAMNYASECYEAINPNIQPEFPGNPNVVDPNHWQPIELTVFIDQSGNVSTEIPAFVGPEWGEVVPFSLDSADLESLERDGCTYDVWKNPGAPVHLDSTSVAGGLNDPWKWNFSMVSVWSSHLDPTDSVMWDISPGSLGSSGMFVTEVEDFPDYYDFFEGGGGFTGHTVNPITGEAYAPNWVPRGDYTRCLAEFWADGPDSETPPGHWFTLLNEIMLSPLFETRWRGQGPELDPLEYTLKAYLALAGAMHDCAVATWSVKGYHDYTRPISAIRYMAEMGQSSDTSLTNYHPSGLPLIEGYIEVVEDGDPLAGFSNENIGEIKVYAWRGPDYVEVPFIDEAGVGWILAKNWWPYQRPSFVTPPFAGYVSGHSTFSRAAAEVLTLLTGSEYFPGGIGTFPVTMNQFLVFEDGPSMSFELQWATYYDAANESALSRMWGGIHPPMDDGRGRQIGQEIGIQSFHCAEGYSFPQWSMGCGGEGFLAGGFCPGDFNADAIINVSDFLLFLSAFGNDWNGPYDLDGNAVVGSADLLEFLTLYGEVCP
jgi:hypothetical protein